MDQMDRKILDIIQTEIPIAPNAFKIVANQAGTTEKDLLSRINALKNKGIIRRIGGSFDSAGLGYHSVLVAAKVPKNKLPATVEMLNKYTGVTHNYLRDHEYNLWFTLTASSETRVYEIIEILKDKTGVKKMTPLPSLQKFKIKVHFKMSEDN